jgi:hypothetical protein
LAWTPGARGLVEDAVGTALEAGCVSDGLASAAADNCTDVAGDDTTPGARGVAPGVAGGRTATIANRNCPSACWTESVSVEPITCPCGRVRLNVCRPICTCDTPFPDWLRTRASTVCPAACANARRLALAWASEMGGSWDDMLIGRATPATSCGRQQV